SDVILTQTPSRVSARLNGDISFKCSASQDIGWSLAWYHTPYGQTPRLLIKAGDELYTGVSSRFSGQKSGSDFTLTITGVQAEDAGHYYCQQYSKLPHTVINSHSETSMSLKGHYHPMICCRC
uniref:Ig-like domain-containing protein n=1 Tax=Erpetoichthys calabaricus TaxID=27687 RepID=A0A8C4STQ5_ERPCA